MIAKLKKYIQNIKNFLKNTSDKNKKEFDISSLDMISDQFELPKLKIGDYQYVKNIDKFKVPTLQTFNLTTEQMAALLLLYDNVWYGHDGLLYANCNDIMGPYADAEPLKSDKDVVSLYYSVSTHKYGLTHWIIRRRKRQPWFKTKDRLVKANAWLQEFDQYE